MRLRILLASVMLLQSVVTAAAIGPGGLMHNFKTSPSARFLSGEAGTLAPFAHVVFCLKVPDECRATAGPEEVELDGSKLKELASVNDEVNAEIIPKIMPGLETWSISPTYGSCHDYAITKRHRLLAAGWPIRTLRIAIAMTPEGIGHAILVVKTSAGDLVLDNRSSRILPWKQTDLQWIKIESGEDPQKWLSLRGRYTST